MSGLRCGVFTRLPAAAAPRFEPVEQHGVVRAQDEDEVEKALGKEVVGVIVHHDAALFRHGLQLVQQLKGGARVRISSKWAQVWPSTRRTRSSSSSSTTRVANSSSWPEWKPCSLIWGAPRRHARRKGVNGDKHAQCGGRGPERRPRATRSAHQSTNVDVPETKAVRESLGQRGLSRTRGPCHQDVGGRAAAGGRRHGEASVRQTTFQHSPESGGRRQSASACATAWKAMARLGQLSTRRARQRATSPLTSELSASGGCCSHSQWSAAPFPAPAAILATTFGYGARMTR